MGRDSSSSRLNIFNCNRMIGWDSKTFLHCKTNHYGRFFSNLLFSFPLPDSKECMAEEWNSPMRIHQSSYSKVENIPLCLCRVFVGFIGLLVKALTIGRRKLISRHRSGNVLSTTAACAGCGHLDISISPQSNHSPAKQNPFRKPEETGTLKMRKGAFSSSSDKAVL